MNTLNQISSVSITSLKLAEIILWNIWFMQVHQVCTVAIKKVPFSTDDKVDNPVSLYAATKKSDELMAHAYSKLYNIPSTGLRFFTVYGPAGRPDMAYFGFTNKLVNNETIKIFNYGNCKRDFTYVDDIVEGVKRVMMSPPEKEKMVKTDYRYRHIRSITLETTALKISLILSRYSAKNWFVQEFCHRIMILMHIRNLCQCSQAMYRSRMPIQVHWKRTLVSNRVQALEKESGNLLSGIKNFI